MSTEILIAVPEIEPGTGIEAEVAQAVPDARLRVHPCSSADEVTSELGSAEILYSLWFPKNIEGAPLRWLQMSSTGVDNKLSHPVFDPDGGITVTSASGCHAVPIAEYCVFAFGIAARGLLQFFRDQQQRVRNRSHSTLQDLSGKTVSIVGYGHIGREVGRLARALNMRVLAVKREPESREATGFAISGVGDPEGSLPDRLVGPGELHSVLEEADFVVPTLPLTDATRQLFGRAAFAAMQRHAWFINVSRGGVVDEDALVAALRDGVIGGACLDVLTSDPKPLPSDHPLWSLENVFITPHVSGNRNPDYLARNNVLFLDNLRRYASGGELLNVVTRERGY